MNEVNYTKQERMPNANCEDKVLRKALIKL